MYSCVLKCQKYNRLVRPVNRENTSKHNISSSACPISSSDEERSFSLFKNLFAENRLIFLFETLSKSLAVKLFNSPGNFEVLHKSTIFV